MEILWFSGFGAQNCVLESMIVSNVLPSGSLKYSDRCELFLDLIKCVIDIFPWLDATWWATRSAAAWRFPCWAQLPASLCLHFRESDATGKRSESKPENNWGFSLAKEKWKNHLPDLFSAPAVFGQVHHFTDEISDFFFIFFPIHMPQLTVGKQNCPIFITLLTVLAQHCAWSYSTKRQLLHRRICPACWEQTLQIHRWAIDCESTY